MLYNVCSTTEMLVRMLVGCALLTLVFILDGVARYWGLLGLIPIATAISGYCPVKHLIGVGYCKGKHPLHL